MLKACMNADVDDVDGKLRLTIFTDDTFASDADFTADDVLGAFEWTPQVALDQGFNVITGHPTDPSDTSPGNDTWEQDGATLRFFFDERARTFEATLRPADLRRLSGTVSGGGSFTAEAIPTYAGAPY